MKRFMLTTAIVSATALAAGAQTMGEAPASGAAMPDMLASDVIDRTVYTLAPAEEGELDGGPEVDMSEADMTAEPSPPDEAVGPDGPFADRELWESVGSIDDLVLSSEGEILGVLVDVGGFLGLFAHTVMIDFAELQFHPDPESDDPGSFAIFIDMTEEALEALPEWDETQLEASIEWQTPPDSAG